MFPLRDENPSYSFPLITLILIILNILVFIYQIFLLPEDIDLTLFYGMRPAYLIGNPTPEHYLTLVTSMFLHGGLLHLIGNMWFLWIFGNNVEDILGHFTFLIFYLLSGITASVVYGFLNPYSLIPTIGASGAISGVLGAYILLFPHARIVTLIPIFFILQIVRIPAFFFLGLWFVFQFLGAVSDNAGKMGGIAWFAHIGGFIAGLVLIKIIPKRKRKTRSRFRDLLD